MGLLALPRNNKISHRCISFYRRAFQLQIPPHRNPVPHLLSVASVYDYIVWIYEINNPHHDPAHKIFMKLSARFSGYIKNGKLFDQKVHREMFSAARVKPGAVMLNSEPRGPKMKLSLCRLAGLIGLAKQA